MPYVMEARENYSAALVAGFNAGTPTAPLHCYADQQDVGLNFDAGRRRIMYSIQIATADITVNNTGFTLWDGEASVANGGNVNTVEKWNFWIGEKNIDTDAVVFYQCYNVANTVPVGVGSNSDGTITFAANPTNGLNIVLNGVTWTFVTSGAGAAQTNIGVDLAATLLQLSWDLNNSVNAGIDVAFYTAYPSVTGNLIHIQFLAPGAGGDAYTLAIGTAASAVSGATLSGGTNAHSDGTWRRMTTDMDAYSAFEVPVMVDPYTNNVWIHVFSCFVYRFALSDSFQQKISPLRPRFNVNNPLYPIGITQTWAYSFEQEIFSSPSPHRNTLYLVPAGITSAETALDELLSYAQFVFPTSINTSYFRWCMDHSGHAYFISGQLSGGKNYKLWKFTPPTVVGGKPTTGGGFTDVTPWASNTGPNTDNAAYTSDGGGNPYNQATNSRNNIMYLPATQEFVIITQNYQYENPASTGNFDFDLTFFDCTFYNTGDLSFDYHHAFVTGYMTADWKPTNLAGAAYAVYLVNEHNLYLGESDFLYTGASYTSRWFAFLVFPVTAGVVETNFNFLRTVLVKYTFTSHAAPLVVQVVDEGGWDTAYTTYGATILPNDSPPLADPVPVVANSFVYPGQGFLSDLYVADSGIYDATTESFWYSGATPNMYTLNPIFTPRSLLNGGTVFGSGTAPLPPFLRLQFSPAPPRPLNGPAFFVERMDNRIWNAAEDTWCVDCGLTTYLPTPNAALTASSATGAGIPTAITDLFGGQGYSVMTTAAIEDPTGVAAVVSLTIASGIITGATIIGGFGYTDPQLVFNDPTQLGMGATGTVVLDNSATFTADTAVFSGGDVGSVIRMGGGAATVTTFTDSTHVIANITTPITVTIPNSGGVPATAVAGAWSLAPQVTVVGGLHHLVGFTVTGVADGDPIPPQVVATNGTITLATPASLVTVGLPFLPQFQSLYLDSGNPTIQGQRKKIAGVTVRLDASGVAGIEGGSNQLDGAAQSPPSIEVPWTQMVPFKLPPNQGEPPFGSTIAPLWTGDVRAPVKGGFAKPGQIALQQTLPLPMNILAIVPEGLEGDTPEQTYQPEQPRGKPRGQK